MNLLNASEIAIYINILQSQQQNVVMTTQTHLT